MAGDDAASEPLGEKLRLLKSPVKPDVSEAEVTDESTDGRRPINPAAVKHLGFRSELHDEPQLMRNDDATNLEVFYDLFLACLNLFNQNQQIAALSGLSSYVGFFCLIWTTWLLTGMYDVRYVTDSIFERCARAVHLGVLVGFVTVSPNFNPNDRDPSVFQVFSLILAVSRLCLALEYGSIIFHVRRYTKAKLPLALMVGLNLIAAVVYLSVSFVLRWSSTRVYYIWYIIAGVEILAAVGLSILYRILTFQGTHIIRRMSLLTLIIFGEGVSIACGGVTKVVKVGSHADWTPSAIGVVTACLATIYLVFMLYFDWMRRLHLPPLRQLVWTLLHFPLHLVMTLFMEGCAQFIVFWKVSENSQEYVNRLVGALEHDPSEWVRRVRDSVDYFLERWPATYTTSSDTIDGVFESLGAIDVPEMMARLANMTEAEQAADAEFNTFSEQFNVLAFALDNIMANAYGIDFTRSAADDSAKANPDAAPDPASFQQELATRSSLRFVTVFQYTFASAGAFLVLVNVLYVVARTERFNGRLVARTAVIFLMGIGIALVACLSHSLGRLEQYSSTPWILPTLCLAYLAVMVVNQLVEEKAVFGFPRLRWLVKTPPNERGEA